MGYRHLHRPKAWANVEADLKIRTGVKLRLATEARTLLTERSGFRSSIGVTMASMFPPTINVKPPASRFCIQSVDRWRIAVDKRARLRLSLESVMGAPTSRELSIRERAYHLIQQKIVSGELTSGTAISELSLAKELSSSRTPVREAIGQLVSEGVLEQIPNRGTIVAQFTRHDILELYELRKRLKSTPLKRSRSKRSTVQTRNGCMVWSTKFMCSTRNWSLLTDRFNQEQMQRFVRADLAYHTLLLRLAANRRILKVVQDTRLLMRIFSMRREGHDPGLLVQIHRFHREILDAVVAGNGEAAKRLLREHIQLSRQERLQSIRPLGKGIISSRSTTLCS